MQTIGISYIGNEEDIVESFVRHHCAQLHTMIIVATGSDRTWEILDALRKEGLPLELRRHAARYHDQQEVMTGILRALPQSRSDAWIFLLDGDECIVSADLQGALARLPRNCAAFLPWKTYVPLPTDDREVPCPLRRIRCRRSEERPQFTKVAVHASLITPATTVTAGNHGIVDASSGERLAGRVSDEIALAHFPVRSSGQILGKIRSGWEAVLRNPERRQDEAVHWKQLHDLYAQSKAIDFSTLRRIAIRYACDRDAGEAALVEDPIPCACSLRYTPR